jgi:inosine/xanthosine triphosphatase
MTKSILVASKNPVKLAATLAAFQTMFPGEAFEISGISVPSGVADQPFSDEETLAGALNRANNAFWTDPRTDFYVGIEGGVAETQQGMEAFAWIVVQSGEKIGKGKSGTFFLPRQVRDLIMEGKELGEADDIVFGMTNSKQECGAVGILTGNIIDRTEFYKSAAILALIPFKNVELY